MRTLLVLKEASGNKKRSEILMKLCSENIKIFTGDDKTSMGDIIDGFQWQYFCHCKRCSKMMHEMCNFAATGDTAKASELNNKLDIFCMTHYFVSLIQYL